MGELSNEEFYAIAKKSSKAGYVYAVAFGDCVKIGRAKHPRQRIMAIQTQSGRISEGYAIFQCTDYGKCERGVHSMLKEHRSIGEYFEVSLEMGSFYVQKFIDENNLKATREWADKEIVCISEKREEFENFSKSIVGTTVELPHNFDTKSVVISIVGTMFHNSIQGMMLQHIFNTGNTFFDDYQMDALEDYIKNDKSLHLFPFDKSEIDYVDSETCFWYCFETVQAINSIISEKFAELMDIVLSDNK